MSLPKFPSLEDDMKKDLNNKTLDDEDMLDEMINDFESESNIPDKLKEKEIPQKTNEDSGGNINLPSLDDELTKNDEQHTTDNIHNDEEQLEENQDIPENERLPEDNVEYDDMEELDEEELGDEYGFLPGVNPEEEEEIEEDLLPGMEAEQTHDDDDNNDDDDFKEIDEDKIDDIKNKIKSFFNDTKETIKKNKSEPKKNDNKEDPKGSKEGKIKSNSTGIIKHLFGIIIIVILIFFGYRLLSGRASELSKLSSTVKQNDLEIVFDDFSYDNKLSVNITNNSETSVVFISELNISESTINPFSKDKFLCESDIIFLEQGEETKESLTCDNFIEDLKYKVKVNLEEIK